MKPGIYKGKGKGFDWIKPVEVEVEVDEKSIKNINIVDFKNTRETKPYLKSVEDCMIPRIIESQSLKVDAICGATMSSSGVKGAVRDALKQASAAGGDPEEYKKFNKDLKKKTDVIELKYDVVVAGLAGAGMAAAISAAEQMKKAERPVSVLGLETSGKIGTMPAEIFGINPKRYCDKYNGGKPYFDDPEELYDYWVNEYNHGVCKPELLRLLFDESGETLDWLEFDHGCYMHSAMKGFGECKWLCKYRFQLGSGWEDGHVYEGLQRNWDRYEAMDFYYRRLTDDFVKLGGEYMLETTVYELLYDKDRRKVTGVKARRYDGTEYIIHADVVVSCTGGFHGNPDMMEKYLSDEYYPFKSREWHLYGMGQNKGQLIQSAIDNGAATYNIGMSPLIHLKAPAGFINKYPYQIRENPKTHAKELWSVNDVACSIGCQEMGIRISKNGRRTHNEGGTFAFWTAGPTWYSICGTDYLNQIAEKGFEGPEGGLSRSARINCYGGVPNNMPVPGDLSSGTAPPPPKRPRMRAGSEYGEQVWNSRISKNPRSRRATVTTRRAARASG